MTNQKLSFAVENITPVEDNSIDKSQFSKLLIDCFSTALSRHNTIVSEETLRRTAKSILLKPFVFAIDKRFDDLSTHVPDEVPGGFVPADSKIDFKRMGDGSLMMSVEALIWKRYSGPLLEYFKRDGGVKGVSVEIEVLDANEDKKTGILEILDLVFQCVTGLGDLVSPAIPNAAAVLVFGEEFDEARKEYDETFSDRYGEIDFTIPARVKKNAQKALDKYKETGKGANSVALANARFLVKSERITPERVKQMAKFFNRKNTDPDEVTLGLWGGKESAAWSKTLFDAITEADSKRVSYFDDADSESKEVGKGMKKKEQEETPEEEKKESPEEEKKEQEMAAPEAEEKPEEKKDEMAAPAEEEKPADEEEFSFGFDASGLMAMLSAEEGDGEEMMGRFAAAKEELGKGKDCDMPKVMSAMYAKMQKMAEDSKAMMSENEGLKKFKADADAQQKQFAVDATIKELCDKVAIPEETVVEMKSEAEKFEFAQIDGWKNSVKARAVDFAVRQDSKKDDIVKIAIPISVWGAKSKDDLWGKLN